MMTDFVLLALSLACLAACWWFAMRLAVSSRIQSEEKLNFLKAEAALLKLIKTIFDDRRAKCPVSPEEDAAYVALFKDYAEIRYGDREAITPASGFFKPTDAKAAGSEFALDRPAGVVRPGDKVIKPEVVRP